MKQNKKNIQVLVLVISISVLFFCFYLLFNKNTQQNFFVKEAPLNENVKNSLISLTVLGQNYSIKTEEGISVYDVMKSIEDKNFSFKATEYPGMGYFVEEINGVKGASGKYWSYYVNDQKPSVGISEYVLKNGDIVKWNME